MIMISHCNGFKNTQLLFIADIILVKLMKVFEIKIDKEVASLYIFVLQKQQRQQAAIDFINENKEVLGNSRFEI